MRLNNLFRDLFKFSHNLLLLMYIMALGLS